MVREEKGRNRIETFPARLAELREKSGLSQQALAVQAGTSVSSIAKLERGERYPSLDLAGRIADALGVLVDDLRQPPQSHPEVPPDRPPGRPKKAADSPPQASKPTPKKRKAKTTDEDASKPKGRRKAT